MHGGLETTATIPESLPLNAPARACLQLLISRLPGLVESDSSDSTSDALEKACGPVLHGRTLFTLYDLVSVFIYR